MTGSTRQDALEKAARALEEFEITGLPTVIPFHREVIRNPSFAATDPNDFQVHTRWIESEFHGDIPPWAGAIEDGFDSHEAYRTVVVEVEGRRVKVGIPSGIFSAGQQASLGKPPKRTSSVTAAGSLGGSVLAPMQATVISVRVRAGEPVVMGEPICVLEAMKMEQPVAATSDGIIGHVGVRVGDVVSAGELIATIS